MGCSVSSPNPTPRDEVIDPNDPLSLRQQALAIPANWQGVDSPRSLRAFFRKHPDIPLDFALTEEQSRQILLRPHNSGDFRPGSTMLHNAAAHGQLAVVEWLLVSPVGRAPLNSPDTLGTPLTLACITGHLEIVRRLIEAGARVNEVDFVGRSVLHIAAFQAPPAVIWLLLQSGADIDAGAKTGRTPEEDAARIEDSIQRAAAVAVFAQWRQDKGLPAKAMTPKEVARERAKELRMALQAKGSASTTQAVQQTHKPAMTEAGAAACKAVAFRLAKLALVGAPAVAKGAPPLIDRAALESLLFETLSCDPVVSYLERESAASGAGDADASAAGASAGHRQVALCDFVLPMLRPFLDEPPQSIRDEMTRALSSFMQVHKDRAQPTALMQPQQRSAMSAPEPMRPHDSPPAYDAAAAAPVPFAAPIYAATHSDSTPAPTFAATTATGDSACWSAHSPTIAATCATADDPSWSPRKE